MNVSVILVFKIPITTYFPVFFMKPLVTCINGIVQKYNLDDLGNQSNLYLYGHRDINLTDNKKILLSTIKYIKETRRFSTSVVSLPDE